MKSLYTSDGKPSGTKVWFTLFAIVCLVKFALGGMTINGVEFPEFDHEGAAMLMTVLGLTYVGRRNVRIGNDNQD